MIGDLLLGIRTLVLDPYFSALEIPESDERATPGAVTVWITLDPEAVPLSDRNLCELVMGAIVNHECNEVPGKIMMLEGSLRDPSHATVSEGPSDIPFTLIGKTPIVAKTRLIAIGSKSETLQQFKARLPREVLVFQHGLGASGRFRLTGCWA